MTIRHVLCACDRCRVKRPVVVAHIGLGPTCRACGVGTMRPIGQERTPARTPVLTELQRCPHCGGCNGVRIQGEFRWRCLDCIRRQVPYMDAKYL